jgi:hypothetical protein
VQVSVVHVFPSSQFNVPLPPVHAPETHVLAAENVNPEQDEAAQSVPSVALLNADALADDSQTRQTSAADA